MPWCPECKNEYVEGTAVCADCGTKLVDSLKEKSGSPVIFGEKEQMERLAEFLLYNDIKTAEVCYEEDDEVYELFVSSEERQKASTAVRVFLQQEEAKKAEELLPEDKSDIAQYPMPVVSRSLYQDSAKKAEENRSSAYMLLIIGIIGFLFIVLVFMDIVVLPVALTNKFMICGVMGGLFVLFIVMGIVSMKSSKVLEKKAESENNLTSEIKKWCDENLTLQKVDENLIGEEDTSEEIRYFKRAEKMKSMISHQFMNLDDGFLDSFVDDYYQHIYE